MGQTARLCIIRDRLIAGHSSCELCRHLDSVSPETLIRDSVDRCQVWESHTDLDIQRASKPGPDPTYLTYAVSGSDGGMDDLRVAAVTIPQSAPHQLEPPTMGQLLQRLLPEAHSRQPVPSAATGISVWKLCCKIFFPGV